VHTTVVSGATGILRPAVETLLTAGTNVIAVGRDPGRFAALRDVTNDALGKLIDLPHDATSLAFVDSLAVLAKDGGLVVDDVIAYAPATSPEVLSAVTRDGQVPAVEVVTSSAAAPAPSGTSWSLSDLPGRPWKRLVLGWQYADDGAAEWHGPSEISAAALTTRDGTSDDILGVVSLWSDRPG
jgi:hypothetical protein